MAKNKSYKPDWVPENAGEAFATKVVKGVEAESVINNHKSGKKRKELRVDDYVEGVLNNDRTVLARTITLIESNSQKHNDIAQNVLKTILPKTGNSLRVGITGFPGAGKSSLIETLGIYLINKGHKVAVLAIDP